MSEQLHFAPPTPEAAPTPPITPTLFDFENMPPVTPNINDQLPAVEPGQTLLDPSQSTIAEASPEAPDPKIARFAGEVGAVSLRGLVEKPALAVNTVRQAWTRHAIRVDEEKLNLAEHRVGVVRTAGAAFLEKRAINPKVASYSHETSPNSLWDIMARRKLEAVRDHAEHELKAMFAKTSIYGRPIPLPPSLNTTISGPRPNAGKPMKDNHRIDVYGKAIPGVPQKAPPVTLPQNAKAPRPSEVRYEMTASRDAQGNPRYKTVNRTDASGNVMRDPATNRILTRQEPVMEQANDIDHPEIFRQRVLSDTLLTHAEKQRHLKELAKYTHLKHEVHERRAFLRAASRIGVEDAGHVRDPRSDLSIKGKVSSFVKLRHVRRLVNEQAVLHNRNDRKPEHLENLEDQAEDLRESIRARR